ncbi:unnamed protein product [Dovyalis caffra]|uniref:Uncharacterized protein n=1 Tax=Dovyalis caffra TaxID=77055 RepID=A0AAV1R1P0_9ROSI|nr:unnamed protein product [Dovyalis caffra]
MVWATERVDGGPEATIKFTYGQGELTIISDENGDDVEVWRLRGKYGGCMNLYSYPNE